jgi:spore germination protein YaaH
VRTTGIRDLFVHSGPFEADGTLDHGRIPQARWFVAAIHAALPGVRVQAWLGAHSVPETVLGSIDGVLDLGFDGVHYDFEPIAEGDDGLISVLRKTHELTKKRRAILSVSAIHTEPWADLAACVDLIPGRMALWSTDYLRRVAQEVDQIAVMSYDTAMPTEAAYGGYLRRATENALRAVPAHVALLMGVPAYHDQRFFRYDRAETVAAALRGVRLALGSAAPPRDFGVAIYVDFAATEQDWASYHRDWADRPVVG